MLGVVGNRRNYNVYNETKKGGIMEEINMLELAKTFLDADDTVQEMTTYVNEIIGDNTDTVEVSVDRLQCIIGMLGNLNTMSKALYEAFATVGDVIKINSPK
jgi:hypothetical protein